MDALDLDTISNEMYDNTECHRFRKHWHRALYGYSVVWLGNGLQALPAGLHSLAEKNGA